MSWPAFVGTGTLLREGECVWGRDTGTDTRQVAPPTTAAITRPR